MNHQTGVLTHYDKIAICFFESLIREIQVKHKASNLPAFRIKYFAELQRLSPDYFSNIIKENTGKPVGFWIRQRLVAIAEMALKDEDISIKEITTALNFVDQAHFSNFFKKQTNQSPLEYRRSNNKYAGSQIFKL